MALREVKPSTNRLNITGGEDSTGKPNPTKFEGFFCGTYEVPNSLNPERPSKVHVFQTDKGRQEVWGKGTMNGSLRNINPGTFVVINYEGLKKVDGKPGMKQHTFIVQADDELFDAAATLNNDSQAPTLDLDTDDVPAPAFVATKSKQDVEALLRRKTK